MVLLVVAALWYLEWPPRTSAGYRSEAEQTVSAYRSEVATAQLWGRELAHDHVFLRTVRVALSEMEDDATSTASHFGARQPPQSLRALHRDVAGLGDEVVRALSELRIAARDDDAARVVELVGQLDDLTGRIDDLARELRS